MCSHLVHLWNTCKALEEPQVGQRAGPSTSHIQQIWDSNISQHHPSVCSHWGWTQCWAPYTSSRAHRAAFPRPFFKNSTEKRVDQFPKPSSRSLHCSVSWRLSVGVRGGTCSHLRTPGKSHLQNVASPRYSSGLAEASFRRLS